MKHCLNLLIHCLLLITTPSLLATPPLEANVPPVYEHIEVKLSAASPGAGLRGHRFRKVVPFTFDDLLKFVDKVENGDLENYTDHELEKISSLLIQFARRGYTPKSELENAIFENDIIQLLIQFEQSENLFYGDSFALAPAMSRTMGPGVGDGPFQIVPCKNAWKRFKRNCGKKWRNVRRFFHQHKEEVIATVVIITVAVATACITGQAQDLDQNLTDNSDNNSNDSPPLITNNSSPESTIFPSEETAPGPCFEEENSAPSSKVDFGRQEDFDFEIPSYSSPSSQANQTLIDHTLMQMTAEDQFKSLLMENYHEPAESKPSGFGENIKKMGSTLFHNLTECLHNDSNPEPFVFNYPNARTQVQDDDFFSDEERAEELRRYRHEAIDWFFSTNLADQYAERDEHSANAFEAALLMQPGAAAEKAFAKTGESIFQTVRNLLRGKRMAAAGQAAKGEAAAGLGAETVAGRALAAEMEASTAGRVLAHQGGALIDISAGRIPKTMASDTCGWKIGQDITNRTRIGTVPKWSTVRQRYWKNTALRIKSDPNFRPEYTSPENIKRMEGGLAPQQYNRNIDKWESMELHHTPPQRDGGLFDFVEVWPKEHARIDDYRYIGS